uniref:Chlorophyllase n=1 Tax=Chaetoceros debilis TaxID=122233 RepID=A0A7S3Q2G3_9STRA
MRSMISICIILIYSHFVSALHICSEEEGGGACPDNSKCCAITDEKSNSASSGCMPYSNHIDGPGTCCGDIKITACPGYYECGYISEISSFPFTSTGEGESESALCTLSDKSGIVIKALPRYRMIAAPISTIRDLYGFPLSHRDEFKENATPVVAYQSSKGPILTSGKADDDKVIKVVLVIVHGSGRNSDGYLYAGMSTAELQSKYQSNEILVIAPRFLVPEDGVFAVPVMTRSGRIDDRIEMKMPLMWNETDPIPHTWRYGANALPPWNSISSYDAMDAIVEHFILQSGKGSRYQNLERIVIAGHSAGGQFTHRWAITSNSPLWTSNSGPSAFGEENLDVLFKSEASRRLRKNSFPTPKLSVIAANPRSFSYLDGRRFRRVINATKFEIPSQERILACPGYNAWEWGYDDGEFDVLHKDNDDYDRIFVNVIPM